MPGPFRLLHRLRPWPAALAGSTLVALFSWGVAQWSDGQLRRQLLSEATVIAQSLPRADLGTLGSSGATPEADAARARLRAQLVRVREAQPRYRLVYLLAPGETDPVFLADSEPRSSPAHTAPGQRYADASAAARRSVTDGSAAIDGPYSDRFGTWVSAFVPTAPAETPSPRVVLAIDVDARDWAWAIAGRAALPISLFLVLTLVAVARLVSRRPVRDAPRPVTRRLLPPLIAVNLLVLGVLALIFAVTPWDRFGVEATTFRAIVLLAGSVNGVLIALQLALIYVALRRTDAGLRAQRSALERSEREYRNQFAENSAVMLLIDPADGRIVDANAAAAAFYGYSTARLRELHVSELNTLPSEIVCARLDAALNSTGHRFAFVHRLADGSLRDVEVCCSRIHFLERPVLHAIVTDVTARNRTAAMLQAERKRLETILAATGVGTWEWTIPTGETVFNERWAEIAGYTLAELSPVSIRTWEQMVNPKDRRISEDALRRHFAGETPMYDVELRVRHKNGHWIWIQDRGTVVERAEDGTPLKMFGTHVDISGRKRYEKEILEKNAELTAANEQARALALRAEAASIAKNDFLANVSHEIRTPLNAILGVAELLADSRLSADQAAQLEVLRTNGAALLDVLNQILDVSKIEAGKLDLQRAVFDPTTVLAEATDGLLAQARAKRLETGVVTDPGVPRALAGDPGRLRQIIANLVANAVKFTSSGSISLHLGVESETPASVRLRFRVRDTGIGIAPDKLPLLFRKFVQADASVTRRFGGTGLGLALCRQLVELMGGSIGVDSSPGEGSEFWFVAPFDRVAAGTATPTGARTPPAVTRMRAVLAARDRRVLLVEDNATNQNIAVRLLAGLGIEAVVANNGEEALARLRKEHFALVLMDVQMPVLDGYSATRKLRGGDSGALDPGIPVVAMTAHARVEDRALCLEAGMNDHLTKPIAYATLFHALERWLPGAAAATPSVPPAAVAVPGGPPPGTDAIVFNASDLLERLAGDAALAEAVVSAFRSELPRQLAALRSGWSARDFTVVRQRAHALRGAAANVGGSALRQAAATLERACLADDKGPLDAAFAEVERAAHALEGALRASADGAASHSSLPPAETAPDRLESAATA